MIARCSSCWRPILEPPPEQKIAQVSCACGFISLFERNVSVVPLRGTLEKVVDRSVVDELLVDSDDPADGQRILASALDLCVRGAQQAVEDDPAAAVAAVWHTAVEFDRQSRRFRSGHRDARYAMQASSRALQFLYGCLGEIGSDMVVDGHVSRDHLQSFTNHFFELASSAAMLAPLLDNLRRGTMTAHARDGAVAIEKTALHSRMQEWLINRDRIERDARVAAAIPTEDVVSADAEEAQRLWLGFAPFEIGSSLFADGHHVLQDLATNHEETVYLIPMRGCPADVAQLFDRLMLTRDRVRRFQAPFYWDLGDIEETDDRHRIARRLVERNWLHYYPIMMLDFGEPAYVVSAEALTYAIADVNSLKNGMLQRVDEQMAEMPGHDPELRAAVSRLRTAANRRFEDLAAVRGRELGLEAAVGIERIGGERLKAGEIDVVWAGRQDGRTLIVVGEVKDFDIVLHRVGSEAALLGKVAAAERQLDRKAAEVRRKWRTLLPEISENRLTDDGTPTILAKALLTSQYLPPHLSTKYPMVTLPEVGTYIESLERWPDDFAPRFARSSVEVLA